jgi:hypothetical protein
MEHRFMIERKHAGEQQQRSNSILANAVARGMNILAVRDEAVARHYLEYKGVPPEVIQRVLRHPDRCRPLTEQQAMSEAIEPTGSGGQASLLEDTDEI